MVESGVTYIMKRNEIGYIKIVKWNEKFEVLNEWVERKNVRNLNIDWKRKYK